VTAHPLVLVLISPQDIVNVASAARLCCNFGVAQLRLVQPEVFDPWRIEGIAHGTGDFIRGITLHDSLAEALAGTTYAAVLTGRERAAKRQVARPREAAAALAGRLAEGPVALVAGREDTGLTNEELDQCRLLVTIATTPAFTSLNLAQAVGIMLHELWVARGGDRVPFKPPRREAGPATAEQLETLFADWERTLAAMDFFKAKGQAAVMRTVREVLFRADLDAREAALFRAVMLEVGHVLRRAGAARGAPGEPAAGAD